MDYVYFCIKLKRFGMKLNLVLIGLVLFAFACGSGEKPAEMEEEVKGSGLPYLGFHDFGPTIKDGKEVMDTIYHTVPEFYLMAQDSAAFTNADVAGKIHVVNFFFTSCPSICPAMIGQMKRLQENTKDIKELIFLSHTVDPKRDSIPKLNAYIKERSLDTHNWFFLYGEKEEVYELGSNGYLVNAMEDEKADGGFLHSEHFVLVDREGRVRGLYDGTKNEQVDKLEQDIRLLLKKEYGQ